MKTPSPSHPMPRREFFKTGAGLAAVAAAVKAGADGLILSRKYSEMRLANLDASGKAVREFSK